MKCMRTPAALLAYCLLFSVSFVVLYPRYFEEKQVPWVVERDEGVGRLNKASHVLNAVEQRQVLGLYEDSQSQKNSPRDHEPEYVCSYH